MFNLDEDLPLEEMLDTWQKESSEKLKLIQCPSETSKSDDFSVLYERLKMEQENKIHIEKCLQDVKEHIEKWKSLMNEILELKNVLKNLESKCNKAKEEADEQNQELKRLKVIDKAQEELLQRYRSSFDFDMEINKKSNILYEVSLKFCSASEMQPVTFTLDVQQNAILECSAPLSNLEKYTKCLPKFLCDLRKLQMNV